MWVLSNSKTGFKIEASSTVFNPSNSLMTISLGMESLFFNKQEIRDTDEKCNADESICYSIIGDINVGNNELKMVVTAENEDEKEYVFTINRKNERSNYGIFNFKKIIYRY